MTQRLRPNGASNGHALSCLIEIARVLGVKVGETGSGAANSSAHIYLLDEIIELAEGLGIILQPLLLTDGSVICADNLAPGTLVKLEDESYAVFGGTRGLSSARVYYPDRGWSTVSRKDFDRHLTETALEATVMLPLHRTRAAVGRLNIRSLISFSRPIRRSFAQAVILSIILQLYVLVSPVYLKMVIDSVTVHDDLALLKVLAVSFALLAVFNAAASLIRAATMRELSVQMNWDMTRGVLHHLLRLPLRWFESRSLGDILSRVQGLEQIRAFLAACVMSLLDGVLSIITLVMLAHFLPGLAFLSVLALGIYALLRAFGVPVSMRLNARSITYSASEHGSRIESIRGIQSIKAMGGEARRESDWSSKLMYAVRSAQDAALAAAFFGTLQTLLATLTTVLAVFIGANAVLRGDITLGVLTAALAYMGQFAQRATSLIEQVIAWRMLDVQLSRLEDIALEAPEPTRSNRRSGSTISKGAIIVDGVVFNYGSGSSNILENLSLSVSSGEHVAIVGPSGAGKTTFLKLLCGLYQPSSGTIEIDGRQVADLSKTELLQSVGVVLQNDELFAGSVADNVAFFERRPDHGRVRECLDFAGIAAEISTLPGGIHATIGDMGTALSGGQRQRLLLARALYKKPKILLLDEATSHLDAAKERTIVHNLRELQITRVVVAHRRETIDAADRVIVLNRGRVSDNIAS